MKVVLSLVMGCDGMMAVDLDVRVDADWNIMESDIHRRTYKFEIQKLTYCQGRRFSENAFMYLQ